MNILDICTGRGGWTKPFRERGHYVVTVDIEKKFKPTICADILKLGYEILKAHGPFDVVTASPPCDEYCKASLPKSWACNRNGSKPDNALVKRCVEIIQDLKPHFWVIENVRGAVPYFKPLLGKPVRHVGSRYLWGEFPMFDAAPRYGKWRLPPSENRKELRAEIPYQLALNFCVACERELLACNSQETK